MRWWLVLVWMASEAWRHADLGSLASGASGPGSGGSGTYFTQVTAGSDGDVAVGTSGGTGAWDALTARGCGLDREGTSAASASRPYTRLGPRV